MSDPLLKMAPIINVAPAIDFNLFRSPIPESREERLSMFLGDARSAFPRFDRFMENIYNIPGNISSISVLKNSIAMGLCLSHRLNAGPSMTDTVANGYVSVALMANLYDFPFWVIPPQMFDVISNIRPPESWDTSLAVMGFPALYFLLPKGKMKGDCGEEVGCLGVSYCTEDVREKMSKNGTIVLGANGSKTKDTMTFTATGVIGEMWSVAIPIPDNRIISEQDILLLETESTVSKAWPIKVLVPFIMTALAIMSARPEISDATEVVTKRIKKSGREVRQPRVLGRKYQTLCEKSLKTGGDGEKTVATHWRRGHLRSQHFGPKNANVKQILIDPVMVNPPE